MCSNRSYPVVPTLALPLLLEFNGHSCGLHQRCTLAMTVGNPDDEVNSLLEVG
jgi:hypothetical protein